MTVTRILHTHDTHQNYPVMPNLVTAFNWLRQDGQSRGMDVLETSGGDYNYENDNPQEAALNVELYNRMGIDAATEGNHELDKGTSPAAITLSRANYPTLVANYNLPPNHPFMQLQSQGKFSLHSVVLHKPHGDYGLIGITTPDLMAHLKTQVPLDGLTVADVNETIRRVQQEINQLQAQGINKIILDSHGGVFLDREIAHRTSGLDVIVGGHTHTVMKGVVPGVNWITSATGEPVLLLQGGKNGHAVAMADILWDAQGHPWPLLNTLIDPQKFPQDPVAQAMIQQVEGSSTPIAVIDRDYPSQELLEGESPQGNFVADAIRQVTGAEIAICRSASLRNGMRAGVMTEEDLHFMAPFPSQLVTLRITGQELIESMARSAQNMGTQTDDDVILHPSGLRYQVQQSTHALMGVQVANPQTGQWEPINPFRFYTVALDEYGAKKAQDYPELRHPERILSTVPMTTADAIRRHIIMQQQQSHSPVITLPREGRIQCLP